MKKTIPPLSKRKRYELLKVVETIQEVSKKILDVEMIILFGSYARGDFVEEDITFYEGHYEEYKSDFDIFIITRNPTEKNMKLKGEIEKKINKMTEIETPVSLIVEDIGYINAKLEESRYFYLDMKKEGILLYDSKKCDLKSGKKLAEEKEKQIKKDDYNDWFENGNISIKKYNYSLIENFIKECAFELHQATERYITAYLLVKTGYKPKTHDLEVLYEKLLKLDKSFKDWFDLENEKEEHYFGLLKKAYIEARYSKNYKITKQELDFLSKRILWLKGLISKLCKQELEK